MKVLLFRNPKGLNAFIFGKKDKRVSGVIADLSVPPVAGCADKNLRQTRLIDLRSAAAFRTGFVPGSYSIPNVECLTAAEASGLFDHRIVYLVADGQQGLEMCGDGSCFGPTAELEGWFSQDVLEEWQTLRTDLGTIEAISAPTLSIRCAAWSTVALQVLDNGQSIPDAPVDSLSFSLSELRASLDGLPVETSLCVICRTTELGSFAASLLWNFGFHKVAYLERG